MVCQGVGACQGPVLHSTLFVIIYPHATCCLVAMLVAPFRSVDSYQKLSACILIIPAHLYSMLGTEYARQDHLPLIVCAAHDMTAIGFASAKVPQDLMFLATKQ